MRTKGIKKKKNVKKRREKMEAQNTCGKTYQQTCLS